MILSLFVAGAVLCAGFFRCGSAIFVAGAGNREVAMCDGGDISWQAQYFVRVRRVDAERFVAGAGNREVVRVVVEVNVAVILEALHVTLGESLVENAHFGSFACHLW